MRDAVRGACELLGLDPLLVANEGKLVAFVPEAPYWWILFVLGVVSLGAALPSAPASLGVFEGSIVAALALLGLGGPSFPLANHDDHINIGF